MQLDYNNTPDVAFAGMIADASPKTVITGRNEEEGAVPFGVGIVQGTDDDQFLLPSEQGQKLKGVTLHQHRADAGDLAGAGAIPEAESNPLMTKGRLWVPVEGAVAADAPAYCRHTANGDNTQLGKFRGDNDGVQQVTTVTPTSADSTLFGLLVSILDAMGRQRTFHFQYTSDSASSATAICDGFRTAMALDEDFTDLITPSGTATLILTAVDKGNPFDVVADGAPGAYASITTGTPASTRADKVPNGIFRSSTGAAGFAILELNLP